MLLFESSWRTSEGCTLNVLVLEIHVNAGIWILIDANSILDDNRL